VVVLGEVAVSYERGFPVVQVMSGKTVAVLDGHTRTPWTLAFHRLAPHLLVSGCLNGHYTLHPAPYTLHPAP